MSSSPTPEVIRTALLRGCAGGLGMAVAYLAVGALTYVLLARTGLNISLVLLLSVLSGPVLGTGGLLVIVYWRARKSRLHAVPSINPGNSDLMK